MPRAITRRPTAAVSPASPEQVVTATVTLLVAIEGAPSGSPAATAFRSALRRKGQDLAAAGGPAALADVLGRIRAADTARADARDAIVDEAWAGLPAWRPRRTDQASDGPVRGRYRDAVASAQAKSAA